MHPYNLIKISSHLQNLPILQQAFIGIASVLVFIFLISNIFILSGYLTEPKYDLHITLKVPKSGQEIEVYLNGGSDLFSKSAITTNDFQTHVFKNLPARINLIRFDPAHKSKLPIILGDIQIKTSADYLTRPNQVVYTVDKTPWKKWHLFDLKPTADEFGFVSTSNDPKFGVPLNLNLTDWANPFEKQRIWYVVLLAASALLAVFSLLMFSVIVRAILSNGGWANLVRRLIETKRPIISFHAKYKLPIFIISGAASFILLYFTVMVYDIYDGYEPTFDLYLNVDIPIKGGSVEIYINDNGHAPFHFNLTGRKPAEFIARNIPENIYKIRLDPVDFAGVTATINEFSIRTSENYRAAPGRKIVDFNPVDMRKWGTSGIKWRPKAGELFATADAPVMVTGFSPPINLLSKLERVPEAPSVIFFLLFILPALSLISSALFIMELKSHVSNAPAPTGGKLAITAIAILCWLITLISAFPGHWTFDQFYSLNELVGGRLSNLHPPMYAVAWLWTIEVGESLGFNETFQVGLFLIIQVTVFWIFAALLALEFNRRWLGALLLIVIMATPSTLSYLGEIGKDGPLGVAGIVAAVATFLALRKKSWWFLAFALAPLFYAFSVRTNSIPGILVLCAYWSFTLISLLSSKDTNESQAAAKGRFSPDALLSTQTRRSLSIVCCTTLLIGSLFVLNAAFYNSVVKNKCCLGIPGFVTVLHDLMGISARSGVNVVPDYGFSGNPLSMDALKKVYFPVSRLDLTGINGLPNAEVRSKLLPVWWRSIVNNPGAYLEHRIELNRYIFGVTLEPVPYPLFLGMFNNTISWVQPSVRDLMNSVDVGLRFKTIQNNIWQYFFLAADSLFFRIWFFMLIVIGSFIAFPFKAGNKFEMLATTLTLSGLLYFLPHILVASSSSFRYFFWTVLSWVIVAFLRFDDAFAKEKTLEAISAAKGALLQGSSSHLPIGERESLCRAVRFFGFVFGSTVSVYVILYAFRNFDIIP
jgi:hypothetical protein